MPSRQKTVLVLSDEEAPAATFAATSEPIGEWKAPLFSLNDANNFAMALCCPAVTLAKILSVFGPVPYAKTLLYFFVYLIILMASIVALMQCPTLVFCITMAVLVALVPALTLFNIRYAMREHYKLPRSDCQDFCVALLCYPFVLAQMSIQVDVNTPGQCDFSDSSTLIAYSNA
ncbi:hypothetical protein THRCLA_20589 [Thraustotheca clavata]|uniref:Transmembrane protein n=1 Tax=Thraustotheca clavata TaxID=74557 RepID=A0A1W0A5H8_9STRA|nr:hypothetical protein THRCLA_20589 [Thraustotheca clavata]